VHLSLGQEPLANDAVESLEVAAAFGRIRRPWTTRMPSTAQLRSSAAFE
jgi:hypothetical protein